MTCICSSFNVQLEGDVKFYDPDDKCLRRDDGTKYRFYWLGCPAHKGRSFRKTPSLVVGLKIANELER
jgi:hypothetical protein